MDLTTALTVAVIIIFFAALIFIPEFRTLLKGFGKLFVKDVASTPEGAEAIYLDKIDQAQDAYNKADEVYRTQAGKLSTAKRHLQQKQECLQNVSKQCESFVASGNMKSAELKAEEREEILSDISRLQELVKVYSQSAARAKEMHEMCEDTLRKLRKEKNDVVENMRVKQQMKEAYDDMDELKRMSPTDKLLESIREKNKDLDASVEGARIVHENKLSTKLQHAEKESQKIKTNDYLESLKRKYNKEN